MKIFEFRLEKVLEYRRMVEEWARQTYLDARVARLESEAQLLAIREEQQGLLEEPIATVEDCQTLDLRLALLDDRVLQQQAALSVLATEEEHAFGVWHQKQKDVKAIEKLRERKVEEWEAELSRMEQAELDEWAVQRRAS